MSIIRGLAKAGVDLAACGLNSCFSVGNKGSIAVEIEGMRSITLVGSIVGAIYERGSKNAGCVGDGVGCRLVKVGIDLNPLRFDSCFSVGDAKDITVGVDGGRSIPLVGSRVDAIDGSGDGKLVGCVAGVS